MVQAARNRAHQVRTAAKAAPETPEQANIQQATAAFQASLEADLVPMSTVLAQLHTDAWVLGVTAAANGVGGERIQANLGPVSVDAPEDWHPGWAATAELSSPPAGLAAVLDSSDADAARITGGLADRIGKAFSDALASGGSLSDIGSAVRGVLDDPAHSAIVAATEAADVAEQASQAAYQAAGFTRWRDIPDPTACALCESKAGVYSVGDRQPPWHPGCGCGSEPVEEDQ